MLRRSRRGSNRIKLLPLLDGIVYKSIAQRQRARHAGVYDDDVAAQQIVPVQKILAYQVKVAAVTRAPLTIIEVQ